MHWIHSVRFLASELLLCVFVLGSHSVVMGSSQLWKLKFCWPYSVFQGWISSPWTTTLLWSQALKNVHIYKIYLFLFCKYRWVPACMYVYQVHDLLKEIRCYQVAWIWSNRQLCADIRVLGNTPGSAGREVSVLNSWAIKGNLMYVSPLWNFLLDLKANTRGAQTPLPR